MTKVFFIYLPMSRGTGVYGVLSTFEGYVVATKICSRRAWLKNDLLFGSPDAQVCLSVYGIGVDEAKESNQMIEVKSVTELLKKLQSLRVASEKSRISQKS